MRVFCMVRDLRKKIGLVLALLFACACQGAAQTDKPKIDLITIKLEEAPLRDGLRTLFGQVELRYSYHPDLGWRPVTMKLHKLKFQEVLRLMMLQVDGIYDVVGSVYAFRPMAKAEQSRELRAPVPVLDAVQYTNADLQLVLIELFRVGMREYRCDRSLQGRVTVDLRKVSFDDALGAILKQTDAAWRVERGRYVIVPVRSYAPFLSPF